VVDDLLARKGFTKMTARAWPEYEAWLAERSAKE
jgi:hypothetical protein